MAGKKSFAGGIQSLLGGSSSDEEEIIKEPVKVVEPEKEALPSPALPEEVASVIAPPPEKASVDKVEETPQPVSTPKKKRSKKDIRTAESEGDKVASFVVNVETLETMKALAYWERKKIKDVLEEAMQAHFTAKGKSYLDKVLREYRNANEV